MFRPGSPHSTKSSTSSRRYRESTHLIPTPGVDRPRPERHVNWPLTTWKVLAVATFMILVGIGIEIALVFSRKNQGFPVPQKNVLSFVQPSFLTAFFPTLLVFPLSYLWGVADRVLRWYQPYVVLSQGGARAEDSLMIDYVMSNILVSLWRTLRRREWIVHISMISALVATLYQPLAGALLSIRQVSMPHEAFVTSTTSPGLAPDVKTLNSFLAAAGFVEAAAFQGLPDPPFVRGGWAVSQFTDSSDEGLNASVSIFGTGVNIDPGCSVPPNISLDTNNSDNYTITATDDDGCSSVASFNPIDDDQQYGTAATLPGTCGFNTSTPVDFLPIMFWFFHTRTNGTRQARAVICRPKLRLQHVIEVVYLVNNSLTDVLMAGNFTDPNNITGSPLNGMPYNGVIFTQTNMTEFVKARAVAIASQIPGAIFRFASQPPAVLQQFFDSPIEFLPLTEKIYTQHLAVSALSVYFVPDVVRNRGCIATSLVDRLVMDTLAAHALATLMILIGLTGVAIHLAHRRVRRHLYLTAPPGTIASAVALTAHSGFGQLLFPYDDARAIRAKLAGLRFGLDRRTGAIVADEVAGGGPAVPRYEGAGDKLELRSVSSRTPLVREAGTPPPDLGAVPELPYERQPLVSRFDD